MKEDQIDGPGASVAANPSAVSGADRRTLAAIFHHPTLHDLSWADVVELIGHIGAVEHDANDKVTFRLGHERHKVHKPLAKQLTAPEAIELRRFVAAAGWSPQLSPGASPEPAVRPDPAAPDLIVVVDHHEATLYLVDVASSDFSEHVIEPYDPWHHLYYLTHKNEDRDRGQRAPEDGTYYERIAQAVAPGGRIVLIGHGKGRSNAAHHLAEHLRDHHHATYQRVLRGTMADLSSLTDHQVLRLGRHALQASP